MENDAELDIDRFVTYASPSALSTSMLSWSSNWQLAMTTPRVMTLMSAVLPSTNIMTQHTTNL
jgi:hypothetical protein